MRRSSRSGQGLWVSIVSESMQEMMEREKAEAVAMMKRANSAMSRIFGIDEEDEGDE